jgi:hypothetical protein
MGSGKGPKISKREARRLKQRIQLTGALSAAISSLVLPGVAAFIVAQYMAHTSLWYALGALGLAQLYRIRLATRDFWSHASISDSATFHRLRLIYLLYLLTTLFVFHEVYQWTRPYDERSD